MCDMAAVCRMCSACGMPSALTRPPTAKCRRAAILLKMNSSNSYCGVAATA